MKSRGAAGVYGQVAAITARAMNGDIGFEAALRDRVALLKGLAVSVLDTVFETQISLMPGAQTLLATMKAHGSYTALVSGGFTHFTDRVAAALGFDESRANTLLHENGVLTGDVATPILGQDAKVTALEQITSARGVSCDDVIAVGDGANDIPMLTRAGIGVVAHAKPKVQAQVNTVIKPRRLNRPAVSARV